MAGVPKVILAKKELVYGTDAAPTAAANAVLTRNFRCVPLEVDQLERNLDLPSRGRSPTAPTNRRSTRTFEVEIAGSGAAGVAPAWMELLESCGMEPPVLAAGADATQRFSPADTDGSSTTFHDWHKSQRRRGLGSRGTFGFNFTAGAYPFLNFSYTSTVPAGSAVEQVAPGAPDFARFKDAVEVNVDNTEIRLAGYVLSCSAFTGEIGANIAIRNLTGERYIGRGNHAITGTLSAKCPDVSTRNFWDNLGAGDLLPFALEHGTVAGNIIQLAAPHFQILTIAITETDDQLGIDIGFGMNVVAGQDDLIVTAK